MVMRLIELMLLTTVINNVIIIIFFQGKRAYFLGRNLDHGSSYRKKMVPSSRNFRFFLDYLSSIT